MITIKYCSGLTNHIETVLIIHWSKYLTHLSCGILTVSSQEGEQSYICMLGVSILPLSTILLLNLRNVSTVWYFLFFIWFPASTVVLIYQTQDTGSSYFIQWYWFTRLRTLVVPISYSCLFNISSNNIIFKYNFTFSSWDATFNDKSTTHPTAWNNKSNSFIYQNTFYL